MKNHRNWLNPFLSAFLLVLTISAWLVLAPREIGGQTTYVIVIGNSMEPGFRNNDLVLIQQAKVYNVNDIVVYKQPDIGIVFHRIIRIDGAHYIFKGDNNSWEDSYHPDQRELIGKLWIHIPTAGKALRILRTPVGFSSLVIIFSFLLILIIFSDINRIKRHNKEKHIQTIKFNKSIKDRGMDNNNSDSLYLIASIGFIAIILAIVSFSQAIVTSTDDNYSFTHNGHFEYFSAVPDDIYDNDILQSGDPIYRQINDSFNIVFTYDIKSEKPLTSINGTYRMVAIIKEASGWERSLELIKPSLINVEKFTSSAVVDLTQIQSLIDNFEKQTGVANNRYTLVIQPEVVINGKINGRKFQDNFTPDLRFSLDDQKLVLLNDNDLSVDVFNPVKDSIAIGTRNTPNTISILGLQLNILIARIISIYTIIGTAIAAFWVLYKNGYFHKSITKEK